MVFIFFPYFVIDVVTNIYSNNTLEMLNCRNLGSNLYVPHNICHHSETITLQRF
jgi:hypothetical protein